MTSFCDLPSLPSPNSVTSSALHLAPLFFGGGWRVPPPLPPPPSPWCWPVFSLMYCLRGRPDNEIESFNLFTIVMQILPCFRPAIGSVAMQMKQQLTAMDRVRLLSSGSVLGPAAVCFLKSLPPVRTCPAVPSPSGHHDGRKCRGKLSDKHILRWPRGEPPL